jgi:hypothetical protein
MMFDCYVWPLLLEINAAVARADPSVRIFGSSESDREVERVAGYACDAQWMPDEEAYRQHLRPRHTVSASMKVLGFIAVTSGFAGAAIGLLKAIRHFVH